MLDLCCGGMGGWSQAAWFAAQNDWPYFHVIGVDHDLPAAAMHAINHQTALCPNVELPPKWLVERAMSVTFHADITNMNMLQSIVLLAPEMWCFSFPCPPWSSAANQLGLSCTVGQVLVHGLLLARAMRPRMVLLENVQNIMEHPDFQHVLTIIAYCGYRIVHQGIHEAAERLPCKRPRYLAILERMEEEPSEHHWDSWGPPSQAAPCVWDAYVYSGEQEMKHFRLTHDEFHKYMDARFLPSTAPLSARSNIMRYRVPSTSQKTPVCMANYGNHHNLPDELLENKGMMGFFTTERNIIRWYKPLELAMLHCQVKAIALLIPPKQAWHALGNAIVFHHSYMTLWNALKRMFKIPDQATLYKHIQKAEQQRLKASTSVVQSDQFAWYATPQGEVSLASILHLMVQSMQWEGQSQPHWPVNTYFDPQQGALAIDCTQLTERELNLVISPTWPMDKEETTCVDDKQDLRPDPQVEPTKMATQLDVVSSDDEKVNDVRDEDVGHPLQIEQHQLETTNTTGVQVMPFLIPGTYGCLSIDASMTNGDVVSLWEYQVLPCTLLAYDQISSPALQAFLLGPAETAWLAPTRIIDEHCVLEYPDDQPAILIWDDHRGTTASNVNDLAWSEVRTRIEYGDKDAFDAYGALPTEFQFEGPTRIFSTEIPVQHVTEPSTIAQHMNRIHVTLRTPRDTDMLIYIMSGPSDSLASVATLWHLALDEAWQSQHHRKMAFQALSTTEVQFLFRPAGTGFATPSLVLQHHVHARIFCTMIRAFHDPHSMNQLKFKWSSRVFVTCNTDVLPATELLAIARHTFGILHDGRTPSYIAGGKRITDLTELEDLVMKQSDGECKLHVLHLVMPLAGGGGAKNEHRQYLHSELATSLLEHGMPSKDVPPCVEQIIRQVGLPKLTHIVCNMKPEERFDQIKAICESMKISWPVNTTHKAQRKFQKIAQNRNVRDLRNIDPSQYELQPGFFQLSDGKPAPVLDEIVPGKTGIFMTTPAQAEPWLSQPATRGPDELALFVIGPLPRTDVDAKRVAAPATNLQGETCILAGWLVQLGSVPIKTQPQELPSVQTNDVQTCAFTIWSDEHEPDAWQQAVHAPVRFAKKILEKEGNSEILLSPHGRTFRKDNQPVPPAQATSVQFHAELKLSDLRATLRRSGHNKLYVTPKDSEGKASSMWKVIWLSLPKEVIQVRAAAFPSAAGLVRGRQGFGIRVETKHFVELWNHFFPGMDPPNFSPEGIVWKVHPLPAGVDKQVLKEWAASYDWEIHPTRPLGQKAWLFTAAPPPKHQIMYFNGTPLILKQMQQNNTTQQVGLIAGPRSKMPKEVSLSNAASSTERTPYRTGDPFFDPWKRAAADAAKRSGHTDTTGPTTKHLETHDKQLQALEVAVKELRVQQEQQANSTTERFNHIETKVAQHHTETQQAFMSFKTDFEKTLHHAMSGQEQRISSTLEEMKQLLQRNEKRKNRDDDASGGDEGML